MRVGVSRPKLYFTLHKKDITNLVRKSSFGRDHNCNYSLKFCCELSYSVYLFYMWVRRSEVAFNFSSDFMTKVPSSSVVIVGISCTDS